MIRLTTTSSAAEAESDAVGSPIRYRAFTRDPSDIASDPTTVLGRGRDRGARRGAGGEGLATAKARFEFLASLPLADPTPDLGLGDRTHSLLLRADRVIQ